jgi:RNA polymerase sigma-70 factor (ECF subfamily)
VTPAPNDLAVICAREYPRLVGALALLTGDRELARDLAQEAVVRLCRDWPRVREMRSPGGWLHRVGVNLARSRFRRLGAELRANQRAVAGDTDDDLALEGAADRLVVRAALATLPLRQREAVVLHYYLGHPLEEVAVLLGMRTGTVKSTLHRGRAALRVALGDAERQPLRETA